MGNNEVLDSKLQFRNIQPTAMRLLVLDFLYQQESAVSLADLENHFERSDRTTLYRTLKTFEEHGLVHQIHDDSGSTKYALCSDDCDCSYPDDTHVHFFCTSCGKTYCFPRMAIPAFDLPDQFMPVSGNFVINGYCSTCPS